MQPLDEEDDVQVIRLNCRNKTAHITTHQDPLSGKTIVLWNDILRVFPDALYLQRGKRVLPFLKGADFEDLRPPRIAAIPGAVLDVIVKDELDQDAAGRQQEGATTTHLETPPQSKPAVTIAAATSTVKRNPAYGDELAALENYNHIDPPSDFASRSIAAYGGAGTATDNSSSSTHIERPRAAAVGRNPAYGDELAALENYNHIDIPNTSARGPQLIPDNPAGSSKVFFYNPQGPSNSTKYGSRAPQLHPEKTPTWTVGSPRREGAKPESVRLGVMDEKDGRAPSPIASKQNAAETEQPGYEDFQKGVQHEMGLGGVQIDYGLAMECYLRAAEQGHCEAFYNIARLYEFGRGVSKDESKAIEWYIKAGEKGHLLSQRGLAYRYAQGKGVPRDPSEALVWYLKAAEQGDTFAQTKLANMYRLGLGVPIDEAKAMEWYEAAAKGGHQVARDRINDLNNTIPNREELRLQQEPRKRPQRPSRKITSLGGAIKSLFA